jgi:hypothetical protein
MAELAPHETLELHELFSSSSSEIKSHSSSLNSVKDEELRVFMEGYIQFEESNLQAIQKLIETISQNK